MNRTGGLARTSIEKQAADLLETVDDAITLVSQFKFGSLAIYEDRQVDWHHKYSLEALVRVMYVREFTAIPGKNSTTTSRNTIEQSGSDLTHRNSLTVNQHRLVRHSRVRGMTTSAPNSSVTSRTRRSGYSRLLTSRKLRIGRLLR